MNKLNKKLVVFGLLAVAGLSGCASVGTAGGGTVNNKKDGVIYGYSTSDIVGTKKQLCDAIKNADARCLDGVGYQVVAIMSSHGFSDGGYGIMALATKDVNVINCTRPKFNSCTFYKAKIESGKLGTVLEVASLPNEKKCDWSGLNGAGGTVCPAYNWDYRNDNKSAVEY